MNLRMANTVKGNGWRGIVLSRPVIRTKTGLQNAWVIGFCTEFSAKDQIKAFCNERGGSWDGVERFWYVPLEGTKPAEVLESFWKIAVEAVEPFGAALEMGGINISVDAGLNAETQSRVSGWLEKRIRIFNSGLQAVPTSAAVLTLPAVVAIEKQEDEDENGVVRAVRYVAKAMGQSEYVYPFKPQDNDGIYGVQQGRDSEGKLWYWLDGEKSICDSFRQSGGWFEVSKDV